jgi:hypothetical protein
MAHRSQAGATRAQMGDSPTHWENNTMQVINGPPHTHLDLHLDSVPLLLHPQRPVSLPIPSLHPPGSHTTRSAHQQAHLRSHTSSCRPHTVHQKAGSPPASGAGRCPREGGQSVARLATPPLCSHLGTCALTWSWCPSWWHWRQSLQANGTQSG